MINKVEIAMANSYSLRYLNVARIAPYTQLRKVSVCSGFSSLTKSYRIVLAT